jgi:transcriptional regulator with XRE-family HTH domain
MPARMTGRAFFGRRLRIAREQQIPTMSRRALGERVQVSDSAVAAWESGRNIPDPKTLRSVERILGTDGLLEDIVENMVTGEKPQEFIGKWANVEAQATMLLRFSFEVFPGLLQIEEYARAILRDDEQVRARMERKKVMVKEDPPVLVALIDESVLHRNVGGPLVMRDQLNYLEEMTLRDDIIIQVIKMSSSIGAQYTGPFSLASYNGETAIGHIDDAISGDVVENADEVSRLRRMFEMLRKHALSEEESIRLIRKAAEAWTSSI